MPVLPAGQLAQPSAPRPALRQSQARFSNATERQADQVGDQIYQIQRQEIARANALALNQAKLAAEKLMHDQLAAMQEIKGNDALGLTESALPEWQKGMDAIGGKLGNQAQRDAFAGLSAQMESRFYGQVSRHVSGEAAALEAQTFEGQHAERLRGLSLSVGAGGIHDIEADAFTVLQAIGESDLAIEQRGDAEGWDQSTIDAMKAQRRNEYHTDAVRLLLDQGRTDDAQQYFDGAESDLLTDQRRALRAAIDKASQVDDSLAREAQAQATVDSLMTEHGGKDDAFQQRWDAVGRIKDIELRDSTARRLQAAQALEDNADNRAKKQLNTQTAVDWPNLTEAERQATVAAMPDDLRLQWREVLDAEAQQAAEGQQEIVRATAEQQIATFAAQRADEFAGDKSQFMAAVMQEYGGQYGGAVSMELASEAWDNAGKADDVNRKMVLQALADTEGVQVRDLSETQRSQAATLFTTIRGAVNNPSGEWQAQHVRNQVAILKAKLPSGDSLEEMVKLSPADARLAVARMDEAERTAFLSALERFEPGASTRAFTGFAGVLRTSDSREQQRRLPRPVTPWPEQAAAKARAQAEKQQRTNEISRIVRLQVGRAEYVGPEGTLYGPEAAQAQMVEDIEAGGAPPKWMLGAMATIGVDDQFWEAFSAPGMTTADKVALSNRYMQRIINATQ